MTVRILINNLIRGAGTVMELGPVRKEMCFRFYNPANSALESMAKDFNAVGDDFKKVLYDQKKELDHCP